MHTTTHSAPRIERRALYRLPWTSTDNPGGWIEVSDQCDLTCRGCYRHRLEGHRRLEDVLADVVVCQEITNCDAMAIAGGEPLIYPHIVEVVRFVAARGLKPAIYTNGNALTRNLCLSLKQAGLSKFHFHIDSGQERPDWSGRSEAELNVLRERYADLVASVGGIQCGYHVTVSRRNLGELPAIMEWCQKNIRKVHHVSFLAFRTIPLDGRFDYYAGGRRWDLSGLQNSTAEPEEEPVTTEDMFGILEGRCAGMRPAMYLDGTALTQSNKYLIAVSLGSDHGIYGHLGAKALELAQALYHLTRGRYLAFATNPIVGGAIFLLGAFDREVRRAFRNFARLALKDPSCLFAPILAQSVHFQQPVEIVDGKVNLCDGCLNMMVYKGRLINSCRMDEYRMLGGLIVPVRHATDHTSPREQEVRDGAIA